jgi:hypothetical protein
MRITRRLSILVRHTQTVLTSRRAVTNLLPNNMLTTYHTYLLTLSSSTRMAPRWTMADAPAGWTFTTPALNTLQDTQSGSCYLGKKCEVFDAELHAISEALPLLLSAPGRPSKVVLCVDNQSALLV